MKRRTIYTIAMFTAALTLISGANLALARGGGGGGGKGSCVSSGARGAGAGMAQNSNRYQNQNMQQQQYQYGQETGAASSPAERGDMRGDQLQSRDRMQLRDPATHNIDSAE